MMSLCAMVSHALVAVATVLMVFALLIVHNAKYCGVRVSIKH